MPYYLTICRGCHTRWPDGQIMTGMSINTEHQRCDGCGNVADALAITAFGEQPDGMSLPVDDIRARFHGGDTS